MSAAIQNTASVGALPLVLARFKSAFAGKNQPALGVAERLTWAALCKEITTERREGQKDGPNVVLARVTPEPNGQAGRLKRDVAARTAIALDCETHKKTGEVPPTIDQLVSRILSCGWAAVVYTSHNHCALAPRYRVILPLTAEIPANLPAVEVIAKMLGVDGVLDTGKIGASSLFYLPSSAPGKLAEHHSIATDGAPICAEWMQNKAGELLAAREAEHALQRATAMRESEARRAEKVRRGFSATDGLIEAIRDRLDMTGELIRHGYRQMGEAFLFPESETGNPGVHILRGNDGVERVFSHHSGDPLAEANLPAWCKVKAVDAVDVVTILDFGGDQTRALHELATRFGIGDKWEARTPPEEPPGFNDVPPPSGDGHHKKANSKAREPRENTGWAAPVDFLTIDNKRAPELRPHHIPAALWPFVDDTAARMGVDPTAVALCALVSCAAVISDDWALQPKRFDTTWTERACIWGAIVGDPSILKSPIISAATRPIDKLEVEAREQHKKAMRQWRVDDNQAKQDKAVSPPQPKLDRYMVEGVTPEALSEVLRDDDEARMRAPAKKVLSRHDEMSEFFGGLDRYKAGGKGSAERGAYLRLYNGGRYTIDRVARGQFAVPSWSACFLGGVQPGPIQRIAREAADDGLLQRFLYCVPDQHAAGMDRNPDQAGLDRYGALFPALTGLHPARQGGSDVVLPIAFHERAHAHREDIDALAQAMSAMPDTSPRLKASFGKWAGMFARLCLTFHLIGVADARASGRDAGVLTVIKEPIAASVAAFMRDIVLPHLMRADALMFNTEQTGHAQWIAGFILAKRLEFIHTREVVAAYKAFRAPETRRELDAVMASLVTMSWLDPDEPNNPAKGVTTWRVNPSVHIDFAARAQAEVQRRTAAREKIAGVVAKTRAAREAPRD